MFLGPCFSRYFFTSGAGLHPADPRSRMPRPAPAGAPAHRCVAENEAADRLVTGASGEVGSAGAEAGGMTHCAQAVRHRVAKYYSGLAECEWPGTAMNRADLGASWRFTSVLA